MQLITSLLLISCALFAHQVSGVYLVNWWHAPAKFGSIRDMISSIRVPTGSDPLTTYYCANGWSGGYMGMQVNSPTERRILFSVWDDGNGGKVDTLKIGEGAHDESFGGEGTGSHAYILYNWKPEESVFFRVSAQVNQTGKYSDYTGYYRTAPTGRWNLIAKYRAHNVTSYLTQSYSFLENWSKSRKNLIREGFYGNQTVINIGGKQAKATMTFQSQSVSDGDIWEQRDVNGESYVRMDGSKDKGLYPPTNNS